ncbi:hypothetical protein LX32DRAFT_681176 [Colletotrichum zoysiae]|uniref:HNH nuclease domain-containing protein n=1 Tax=Colletotrichum zoysiae TaxID=1216348 RepID=A0AAD9HP46_9PEZI|nr:hypothetical protein LX32DRAFT_681176 [Colletotrichum zoysiae]
MDSPRRLPRSTVLTSVRDHPLTQQELDNQSDLSSALSDPDTYSDLVRATERILQQYDSTSSLDDDTCQILLVFQSKLRKRGASALMTDIKTIGKDKAKLASFARYLRDTILKPMKLAGAVKSALGTDGESPNAEAVGFISDFAANAQSSNRNRQPTLKDEILKRDGFRCAFSRVYDRNSAESDLVEVQRGASCAHTHLAHILPIGLRTFDSNSQRESVAVGSIWYALYRYFPELKDKIGPDTLNQHKNLITFAIDVHLEFDRHRLAFLPRQGRPHTYAVKQLNKFPLPAPPGHEDVMTLVSSNDAFPLPDPDYLWVHYQITQILAVSGIGAKIEAEIKASQEDPTTPNPDGSTDLGAIVCRKMLIDI